MGVYQIIGGVPLRGVLRVHGAKNSILPIMAATLAIKGQFRLLDCPDISDVRSASAILQALGCTVRRSGSAVLIDSLSADRTEIPRALMRTMRAAVLFLGALLCRFGEATISAPGGCDLGARPIDLHLLGLRLMGASIRQEGDRLLCTATGLCGCTIALPYPSVGATENLLLAALGCRGTVTLCNAAREPEIGDLIGFLRACGAELQGEGSLLQVVGSVPLHGASYRVMPDRITAATYLCAGAITGGELLLENVRLKHLSAVLEKLSASGCCLQAGVDCVRIRSGGLRSVGSVVTAPYPGFPTDVQALLMSVMTVAQGVSVFEENIFTNRFRHVPALCAMGAKIQTTPHYAIVEGTRRLHGAAVEATDLRGGAAMVLAALAAEGESCIGNTRHIERGYAGFVKALQSCGAQITQKDSRYGRQEKQTGAEAEANLSGGENGPPASCGAGGGAGVPAGARPEAGTP